MKKTLLVLSIASLFAGSANAVMIYSDNGTQLDVSGSVRVALVQTSGERTNDRLDLRNDGSRIKFKFGQALGDGFSALGYVELRPSSLDFGDDISTKYLYAGLSADGLGSLTFGKQKTAGDAFKLADPAEQDVAVNDGAKAADLITSARKVIHFKSDDIYSLGLEASYIFDDESGKTTASVLTESYRPNLNGYQLLAKYKDNLGDVSLQLNALYSHVKKGGTIESSTTVSHLQSQDVFGLAAGLNVADFGIAVDYAKSKENEKQTGKVLSKVTAIQTALTYQVTSLADVYALFHHYTKEKFSASGSGQAKEKVITNGFGIGSHYYLSQSVMTYVEYNRDKSSNVKSYDNAAYVGLRVYF